MNDPPSGIPDPDQGTKMTEQMTADNDGGQAALELLERVEEISADEPGPARLTDGGRARVAEVFNGHLGRGLHPGAAVAVYLNGVLVFDMVGGMPSNVTLRLWMGTRFSGSFLVASRLPPPRCGC